MRLWSVHPRYLDRQALTACWREGLLAQAVILEPSRGYSRHPQLERFRAVEDPMAAVCRYLAAVADEAERRGYRFARERIRDPLATAPPIAVTTGQLMFEWAHLMSKLERRAPDLRRAWQHVEVPDAHPSFHVVAGPVATWERGLPTA
ncbi:pyrimidine dimer DNA glycosylase/endonuclease V [Agromyces sp. Marseille-P2726]|uniref:pyrimidine dimer DNA glycosylase/endonuclease V n=1 Tax=Agromyces sp. Marseille-P2726 TaxID=2709132 RepID=UPI00156F66C9|nr:pyrimidine dimer DNA glycosylase/endonuclease V [Agromyces sp. Marseille-P2726]